MRVSTESASDEIKRLQGCINDLVAVLTLPAVWTGYAPPQICETLVSVLVRMLRPDLAYFRLTESADGESTEWARWTGEEDVPLYEIRRSIEPWLTTESTREEALIRYPAGMSVIRIAVFRVGVQDELGRLIVGSGRADFPTAAERLVIQVAANQAAIGLQEARHLKQQRSETSELERRVKQRTAELAGVNRELRRENLERVRAEKLNRALAGRLIASQEAERTRIARELHDGVCQELASLAVDVSYLRQKGSDIGSRNVQEMLDAFQRRTSDIVESVRLLSHGLHPAVLYHIGLTAALHAHCAEVERQHRIRVTLNAETDVQPSDPTVSLALFRIAQEALRNAARHAGTERVTVTLARRNEMLSLTVADEGCGFDVAAARKNSGLGLASIKERARLIHGRALIRSEPGRGTTIHVRVPVDSIDDALKVETEPSIRSSRRGGPPFDHFE
jgi:signal transduction histidine kinase